MRRFFFASVNHDGFGEEGIANALGERVAASAAAPHGHGFGGGDAALREAHFELCRGRGQGDAGEEEKQNKIDAAYQDEHGNGLWLFNPRFWIALDSIATASRVFSRPRYGPSGNTPVS